MNYKKTEPSIQSNVCKLSLSVINGIDLFTARPFRELLLRIIRYYQKSYGLEIYGYVIMPSKAELIASQSEGVFREVIHSLKTYTTVKIIDLLKNSQDERKQWMLSAFSTAGLNSPDTGFFAVWKQEDHCEQITSSKNLEQELDHIHGLPVHAGLVRRAEDYVCSSASTYNGDTLPDVQADQEEAILPGHKEPVNAIMRS